MKRLAALFTGFLLLAGPAFATITTTQIAGVSEVSANTTYTVPITSAVSAGQGVIVVVYALTNSEATPTVTDSASSCTYTLHSNTNSPSPAGSMMIFSCPNSTGLTTSNTFTVSYATSSKAAIVAFATSGMATSSPYDKAGTAATVSTASTALLFTSASPAMAVANELVLAASVVLVDASGLSISSPGGGFSSVATVGPAGSNQPALYVYGQNLASGTATMSGTWSAAVTSGGNYYLFKPAASAVVFHNLMTLGVGE